MVSSIAGVLVGASVVKAMAGYHLRKQRLSKIIPDFSEDECFTKEVALALLADQAMLLPRCGGYAGDA
jgi:hypothetical protein